MVTSWHASIYRVCGRYAEFFFFLQQGHDKTRHNRSLTPPPYMVVQKSQVRIRNYRFHEYRKPGNSFMVTADHGRRHSQHLDQHQGCAPKIPTTLSPWPYSRTQLLLCYRQCFHAWRDCFNRIESTTIPSRSGPPAVERRDIWPLSAGAGPKQ